MKECSPDSNVGSDVPAVVPITLKIRPGNLRFNYPESFTSDLPTMMKCSGSSAAADLPSQLFPNVNLPISVKEFTATKDGAVTLAVVLKGPFEFLGGKFKLGNIDLAVSTVAGKSWTFSGGTTITVGPLAVAVAIVKDGDKYTLTASVESFMLNQLQDLIGPTTITEFVSLLGSLKDFGIKDFKLIKEFGSENFLR